MKIWHSKGTRSLRVVWALEEMQLNYELEILRFPPRLHHREFLDLNVLGTVPYFTDGEISMTESSAICHYLVDKYQKSSFGLAISHPEYGDYLNWLYQSDATLTFPQTLYLRYSTMEPPERQQPQVVEDYRRWFHARLRRLNTHLDGRDYLNDNRFTIADIAVGYALYLGKLNGLDHDYTSMVKAYLERLTDRPAFQRAITLS